MKNTFPDRANPEEVLMRRKAIQVLLTMILKRRKKKDNLNHKEDSPRRFQGIMKDGEKLDLLKILKFLIQFPRINERLPVQSLEEVLLKRPKVC